MSFFISKKFFVFFYYGYKKYRKTRSVINNEDNRFAYTRAFDAHAPRGV